MLIFSNKCGRLANRIFAFAHVIAVARSNNLKVINLSFDEYAEFFMGTADDILCRYPRQKTIVTSRRIRSFLFLVNKAVLLILRRVQFKDSLLHSIVLADLSEYSFKEKRFYNLNHKSFIEIANKKPVVFLFGRFFRDYDNMTINQDAIRKFFEPIEKIRRDIDLFFLKAKRDADIMVGVHIRGEDYREFVDGKYYYTQRQYAEKMKEVELAFQSIKLRFIICSNDQVDLRTFQGLDAVTGLGDPIEDLYTLAKCDYILGAPSTYSMWASFYGDKPLCQLWDLELKISRESFCILPPEVLYNFSFN